MNPIAPLQLRDYALEFLLVEANPEFKPDETIKQRGEIGINFDFKKNPKALQFLVEMDVSINVKEESFRKQPYRIRIKLRSILEFDNGSPASEIQKLLGPNGLAMTYSIARGIVGQATGTSLHGKFLLPTVNFIDLLNEKQKAVALNKTKKTKQLVEQ